MMAADATQGVAPRRGSIGRTTSRLSPDQPVHQQTDPTRAVPDQHDGQDRPLHDVAGKAKASRASITGIFSPSTATRAPSSVTISSDCGTCRQRIIRDRGNA